MYNYPNVTLLASLQNNFISNYYLLKFNLAGSLRVISNELSAEPKLKEINLIPGKKLCPKCLAWSMYSMQGLSLIPDFQKLHKVLTFKIF